MRKQHCTVALQRPSHSLHTTQTGGRPDTSLGPRGWACKQAPALAAFLAERVILCVSLRVLVCIHSHIHRDIDTSDNLNRLIPRTHVLVQATVTALMCSFWLFRRPCPHTASLTCQIPHSVASTHGVTGICSAALPRHTHEGTFSARFRADLPPCNAVLCDV